ncbi:MAG: lytic transglycosylase [Rhodospirillaceae bacterium]|nr:lytic transglycosylase [Rhodospirillaceae bacterium]
MFGKHLLSTVLLVALALPTLVRAEPAQPFEAWLVDLRTEARGLGIGEATLDAALAGVEPIPRVIELDRKQPESTMTAAQYLDRVVSDARISAGRKQLAQHRRQLEEVGAKFGVQPRYIVALWGIETNYGGYTGNFSVVASLETLAYDGRRSSFFRGELLKALQILDQGHITPAAMIGSWAGAMGQSQFMPSSFMNYAVDYDGDGRRDIWGTTGDVFASIANYLAREGWQDDQTWGREVRLPANFDQGLIGYDTTKRLSEWQALGVRRADGGDLPTRDLPGSIVQPDGAGTRAWVVYDNFRTILKWNRSTYFGLAVGRLSDALWVR